MDQSVNVYQQDPEALEPLRAGMTQIVVAHAYNIRLDEMRAPSRLSSKVALARQIAMYLAHIVFSMTLSEVARGFGRDRSTASYAVQRVEALREDPELNRTLGWLEATLRIVVEKAP
jgi:chromosomal replication initiation ATPase DnaA